MPFGWKINFCENICFEKLWFLEDMWLKIWYFGGHSAGNSMVFRGHFIKVGTFDFMHLFNPTDTQPKRQYLFPIPIMLGAGISSKCSSSRCFSSLTNSMRWLIGRFSCSSIVIFLWLPFANIIFPSFVSNLPQ